MKKDFFPSIKKWYLNLSIKHKYMSAYILVVTSSLMILGFYSYSQSIRALTNNTKQNMDYTFDNILSEINHNLEYYNGTVMSFITNSAIFNVLRTGYNRERDGLMWKNMDDIYIPIVASIKDNNKEIERITLYTNYSLPEVGSAFLQSSRVKDTEWYRKANEEFGIHWFYENGILFNACSMYNIWNINADRIGVLYMSLGANSFLTSINDKITSDYILSISDSKGNIVYPENISEPLQKILDIGDNIENDYLVKSAKADGADWVVNLYIPKAKITAEAKEILYATLLLSIGGIVLLSFIGIYVSKAMTNRIESLLQCMKMVESGNMNIDISSNYGDEIGQITNRFAEMVKKLDVTINDLYKAKIAEQKQELRILQAQINPHFLYNVLSTINWKAMEMDNFEVSYMVELLSTFYRTSLNKGNIFTLLEKELENVKAYIDMQLVMHDNSFDVEYEIDKNVLDCNCVNFILQPIVENAISHGIEKKENGKGLIKIKAIAAEDIVKITISDNGIGMDKTTVNSILNGEYSGYGIKNVIERLKLAFGESCSFEIISGETGTTVILAFPCIFQ